MVKLALPYPTKETFMKRNLSVLLLALMAAMVLSGCNTVEGAGKDIEKAGEEVQDAAD
jgi:entericidin A